MIALDNHEYLNQAFSIVWDNGSFIAQECVAVSDMERFMVHEWAIDRDRKGFQVNEFAIVWDIGRFHVHKSIAKSDKSRFSAPPFHPVWGDQTCGALPHVAVWKRRTSHRYTLHLPPSAQTSTANPFHTELHTPKHLPIPIHNKPAFFAVATDKKAAWKSQFSNIHHSKTH